MDELFDLVDDQGRITGTATRSQCHGNPKLIHRAVHVLVFNSSGRLYLQRRSESKLIQPGKWDSSVGGHLSHGESFVTAALRETSEELGFEPSALEYLFAFQVRNEIESENTETYLAIHDGAIRPDPEEIDEGRYWENSEIVVRLGTGTFTPVFEHEFGLLRRSQNALYCSIREKLVP